MKHTIAVYGSLKRGLHNDWGTRDGYFHGTAIITGEMHSLGFFPVLMEKGTNKYKAEIYDISDEMHNRIYNMEINAGYLAEKIDTPYGKAEIFYGDPERFTPERLTNYPKVSEWPVISK